MLYQGEAKRLVLRNGCLLYTSLVAHWSAILPQLAALQIDLTADAVHLLSLGVMDRRPSVLPALYRDLLEQTDRWPLDHPDGLSRQDLPRLQAFAPRLSWLCEELTLSLIHI